VNGTSSLAVYCREVARTTENLANHDRYCADCADAATGHGDRCSDGQNWLHHLRRTEKIVAGLTAHQPTPPDGC